MTNLLCKQFLHVHATSKDQCLIEIKTINVKTNAHLVKISNIQGIIKLVVVNLRFTSERFIYLFECKRSVMISENNRLEYSG